MSGYPFDVMKGVLEEIKGVTYVKILENKTFNYDHELQLPRFSFRVIIKGGKKKKIAKAIYLYRPLGVFSCGNTTVVVNDSQMFEHAINFEVVND